MRVSEAFPSKFLKASDLKDRSHKVTIEEVKQEEMKDGSLKLVVYFQGREKGLTLNKTNGEKIAKKYGDDTDQWGGAEIELYPDTTQFEGRLVDCIRLRLPVQQAGAPGSDDEIPF